MIHRLTRSPAGLPALCWLAALLAGCQPLPLEVTMGGCRIVRSGPTCELARTKDGQLDELKLLVQTNPEAEVTVWQGSRPLMARVQVKDLGRLVITRPVPGVSGLKLVVRRGLRWRSRILPVKEWAPAEWLTKVRDDWWWRGKGEEARQELERRLKGAPLPLDEQAWAKGFLGRMYIDANRIREGKALLSAAIQADQEAGLAADEIRDSARYREVLEEHEHQFEQATWVLRSLEGAVHRDPSSRYWLELNWALSRQAQGDFRGALKHTEAGELWARRFDDQEALGSLLALRGRVLQSMGRAREADELFAGLVAREPAPCRKANLLLSQGRVKLLALAATPSGDPGLLPEEPLEQAYKIFQDRQPETGCPQRRPMLRLPLDRAELALLRGQRGDARRWLDEVEQEIAREPNAELRLDLLQLRGQVALKQGPDGLAAALGFFGDVKREAEARDGAAARAKDGAEWRPSNESYWRALIGIGEVLRAQGQSEEALRSCLEADAYLEQRSREIPLGAGRGGFLGRHERGTSLCLALLIELGRVDQAFDMIRLVRVRELLPVVRAREAATSPDRTVAYRSARQRLDENVAQDEVAPKDDQASLLRERGRLYRELLEAVEKLADGAPAEGRPLLFPPVRADGELALTCHPAWEGGWLCIAASNTEKRSYHVSRIGGEVPAQEMSQTLLGPIDDLLRRARVLRILPYGRQMRSQVDIHLLPYRVDGRTVPLWEAGIDVVYAVDLPGAMAQSAAPAEDSRRALVLADPQGEFPWVRGAAPPIGGALRAAGWPSVTVQIGGEPTRGSWPHKQDPPVTPALRGALRALLEQEDLFVYMGHTAVERSGGWTHALKTADEAGLLVTDVLLLRHVPRWVAMLSCQTAQSSEETGGQEGLGIAQSFVIRGSAAVISTARQVEDRWAAEIGRGLALHGLASTPPDLVSALRLSVAEARRQMPEADLGAFRVVVP